MPATESRSSRSCERCTAGRRSGSPTTPGWCFEVEGDTTADRILDDAATALAQTLGAVRSPTVTGPVVLGGGILGRGGQLADRLVAACGAVEVHTVSDGALGAAVLTLRRAGASVDAAMFQQLATSLIAVR